LGQALIFAIINSTPEPGGKASGQSEIVGYRHGAHQRQVLVYGSNVSTPIAAVVIEVYLLSPETRLGTIIGQVKAGQDLDQCRFSRTIVTQEGMNLTGPEVH